MLCRAVASRPRRELDTQAFEDRHEETLTDQHGHLDEGQHQRSAGNQDAVHSATLLTQAVHDPIWTTPAPGNAPDAHSPAAWVCSAKGRRSLSSSSSSPTRINRLRDTAWSAAGALNSAGRVQLIHSEDADLYRQQILLVDRRSTG